MQICLTDQQNGLIFTIEAAAVLTCRKDPTSNLVTHVITNIMGPKGLQAYAVLESTQEVARRVNAALGSTIDPTVLGFTTTN